MLEPHSLQFSPANRGTASRTAFAWWEIVAMALGALVVIYGAADVASRLAHTYLGDEGSRMAFAPVVAVGDPSLLDRFAASGATTTVLTPVRLKVPSIGVNALVQPVNKKEDGTMGTPSNFTDVGWYMPGAKPGAAGNAVFDGHVNNARGTDGVFANLNQVRLGDYISVEDATGRTLVYKVREVRTYATDEAPLNTIFATTGPSGLVLITCDGDWIPSLHSYDKRFVVVARLVN